MVDFFRGIQNGLLVGGAGAGPSFSGDSWSDWFYSREVLRPVERRLSRYASKMVGLSETDDIVQEGFIGMVKGIRSYRFICPVCARHYQRRSTFDLHARIHGLNSLEPSGSITSYISTCMRNQMRNYASGQSRVNMIQWDMDLQPDNRNDAESYVVVERLKGQLDKERDKRVREYIACILHGYTQTEASVYVAQLLGTKPERIRKVIYAMVAAKKLEKYRRELS